ncbi:MAG: alpha/beta hydrolase [Dermatophilaceae bacterium]
MTGPGSTRRRSNPIIGLAAAAVAAAAGAAVGAVAVDRAQRTRAAMAALESPDELKITPDAEIVVIADDGVPLHVEVDEPTPEAAAAAAKGTTKGGRPDRLPTVVLSHGYCLSLRCWVYQRRALKDAGYRVVSWDQRGHGQSGQGEPDTYVIDQLGADLHAVLEQVVPDGDLVLVGHSMGGMTIMAYGEQFPDVVRDRVIGVGFVATSPGGLTLANGGKLATVARMALERVGPQILGPLSHRPELVANMRRAGRELEDYVVEQNSFASPVSRRVVRYTADMILGTPLDTINDFLKTFDGFDKRPALAHFTRTLVLVFNGRQDILTPPAHSELIVDAIPGSEHVIVNDAGHIIMLEHPDLLNAHLIQLVDQAARARAQAINVARAPRVRRVVTDVAPGRRLKQLEKAAAAAVRAESRRKQRAAKGASQRGA